METHGACGKHAKHRSAGDPSVSVLRCSSISQCAQLCAQCAARDGAGKDVVVVDDCEGMCYRGPVLTVRGSAGGGRPRVGTLPFGGRLAWGVEHHWHKSSVSAETSAEHNIEQHPGRQAIGEPRKYTRWAIAGSNYPASGLNPSTSGSRDGQSPAAIIRHLVSIHLPPARKHSVVCCSGLMRH